MKRFAVVALREIAERRFVLLAAGVAAVIPFFVPLLPGVPGDQADLTRGITALILACAFGLGGSLLVGASVVGRELAERRLSFHFSHPLAAPIVWGGKLAGGLALVLLSELIVFLPASAVSGQFPGLPGLGLDARLPWAGLLCAIPFFLVAWVGSVALRSRSPWLIVDLAFLVALPAVLFVVGRRFLRFGGWFEPVPVISTAIGVLVAALLLATLAQVVVGRTDARRGHGAQSLVLWGVLLAATAAGTLWAERTIDPGVDRLVRAWATPAGARGDLVFVEGSAAPDGAGGVLYLRDLAGGTERVLPMSWESAASADGSRVAIVTVRDTLKTSRRVELEAIDTARGGLVVLDLPDFPERMALSSDGRRLAVVVAGVCQVVELPSLQLVASARVPSEGRWAYAPLFVSDDRVRLHPIRMTHRKSGEPAREITDPVAAEIDIPTKSLSTLGRYPIGTIPFTSVKPAQGLPTEPYFQLHASPDLSRVLVVAFGAARSVRLLDASTGSVLASFDAPGGAANPAACFLADGRAVVAEWVPDGRRLVVLSPQGDRLSEIALPSSTARIRLGYEPVPGLLAVGTEDAARREEWGWSLVDLATGRPRPLAVEPLHRQWWSGASSVPAPGSPASRLALEKGTGRLVLFEPATGAMTPLTRGRRPASR